MEDIHSVAVVHNPSVPNPEVAQTAMTLHLWRLTPLLKNKNRKLRPGSTASHDCREMLLFPSTLDTQNHHSEPKTDVADVETVSM